MRCNVLNYRLCRCALAEIPAFLIAGYETSRSVHILGLYNLEMPMISLVVLLLLGYCSI